jgi:hypothetical protein
MPSNTSNICHTTHGYQARFLLSDAAPVFGPVRRKAHELNLPGDE